MLLGPLDGLTARFELVQLARPVCGRAHVILQASQGVPAHAVLTSSSLASLASPRAERPRACRLGRPAHRAARHARRLSRSHYLSIRRRQWPPTLFPPPPPPPP